ncbi:RNA polymerase sigma factor [Porticoccaceae bacterium LTM1]|nr:RNA polymerase sigma factor [Porticoccaceae bacterium LTM1]
MPGHGKIIDITAKRQDTQRQVLERLFKQHESELRAFLQVRLGSRADSEDILQDLFCKLARIDGLSTQLDPELNPRAYLFTIANNLLIDYLRKRSVRQAHEMEQGVTPFDAPVHITPENIVAANQDLSWVKTVLKKLTPKCRTAFVLKRFQHMGIREIALNMGISESRVNKYIARAMQALRDEMERRHHPVAEKGNLP